MFGDLISLLKRLFQFLRIVNECNTSVHDVIQEKLQVRKLFKYPFQVFSLITMRLCNLTLVFLNIKTIFIALSSGRRLYRYTSNCGRIHKFNV